MVDDISDTSKNKLTIAERKEIVKKVGKELGLQTELEFASQLVFLAEETTDNVVKNLAKDCLNIAESRRDSNLVIFLNPSVSVELCDDSARIRIYVFDLFGDSDVPEGTIEKIYEIIKNGTFASLTFRNKNIDFSMVVPRVSDEYFEQVFRLCLKDALYSVGMAMSTSDHFKDAIDLKTC